MKLVARNALLAASDQVHRLKPQPHGNVRGFKDGADLDGEELAALVALVRANAGGLAAHFTNRSTPPQCGHTGPFGQMHASTRA